MSGARKTKTGSSRWVSKRDVFLASSLNLSLFLCLFLDPTAARAQECYERRQELEISSPVLAYRRAVFITNLGPAQTEVNVAVTLDTQQLIALGKMQPSCDDVRVRYENGFDLAYWIKPGTCNTSATTIIVHLPLLPADGTTIYVYYGNPNVSSNSDADSVYMSFPLEAAWSMEEESWGPVLDSSGNANHGLASGGATPVANGRVGGAGSFDGNDDLAFFVDPALEFPARQAFTLEAWVKPTAGSAGTIFAAMQGPNSPALALRLTTDRRIAFMVGYRASCKEIKENTANATDGVYTIDPDGPGGANPYQALCDMTRDGGGWTLLLKATRANTFNYDASYWTTPNVLNQDDLTLIDADAKYEPFNTLAITDIRAVWPDFSDHEWIEVGVWPAQPALNGFQTYQNFGVPQDSPTFDSRYFSSQAVQTSTPDQEIGRYGINLNPTDLGCGSGPGYVRWGYRFNENGACNWGSDDAGGGIGMKSLRGHLFSAGDWITCCGATGANRSARVEIWGR